MLLSEPLLLALPEPVAEPVALADMAGRPWISGIAGTQYVGAVEHACEAAGFTPRVAHRADDAGLILALVAAGLGAGLVPELACSPTAGVHYVRALPAPPRRHISALLRRGAAQRPALAATLEAITRVTGALPARSRPPRCFLS